MFVGVHNREEEGVLCRKKEGCDVVRRMVAGLLGLYLLFAVVGRFVEGMGGVQCGCGADC